MSTCGHPQPATHKVLVSGTIQAGIDSALVHGVKPPSQPIERIPPHEFRPPHCPWADCPTHRHHDNRPFCYHRHGVFIRRGDRRVIPRFCCLTCRRTFSQQTFALSYYLKRSELAEPVAAGLVAGSAHRQLGRSLGCAPSTITRLSARLGRQALLLHVQALRELPWIDEPIVHDDFETFAVRQESAVGIGTPVGQRSWYIYGLEHAPHRRGGRRSPAQKARRRPPPKVEPGAYRRAFQRILDRLLEKCPPAGRITVISDDHPGYRSGMRSHPARSAFRHQIHPNPKRPHKGAPRSRRARLRDREMFAVDSLHMLMRHSMAHSRRETIAFGRRINALLERGWLFVVWRNWIKGRSERKADRTTPAMSLGLTETPWSWSQVLSHRRFPWRLRVPESWMRTYRREIITPEIGPNCRHDLAHAF